jgi:hypothetical protein
MNVIVHGGTLVNPAALTVTYVSGASLEATVLEVDKKQRVILAPVLKEKPIGYR